MALSTYAELQASLASLLDRSDLTSYIPDFIRLFETEYDADPRTALHRRRICRSRTMTDLEYTSMPANYLSVQSIEIVPDVPAATTTAELLAMDVSALAAKPLKRADPDSLTGLKNAAGDSVTGEPAYYAIVGTELRLYPVPDQAYALLFTVYERLSDIETYDTNWTLEFFPHLYLYGSALQSAPFLREDDRLATWQSLYDTGVERLMRSDPEETSRVPLRTELAALSPRRFLDIETL